MINERLLTMANDVVKTTALPNMKIRAKANTPLDYVVKACLPSQEAMLSTESLNTTLSMISDKAATPFAFTSQSALLIGLSEIEDQYIKPLINQINFVRNVVNPIIRELDGKVNDALNLSKSRDSVINIRKIEVPEFIQGNFGQYIGQFASSHVQKGPSFKPTFNELDRDAIISLARTTDENVNEGLMELSAIWNNWGEGDLFETAYKEIVCGTNEYVGGLVASYRNFMLAIVAFCIADKLSKEPIKGLNLDESNLNVWAMFFRTACARVVQMNVNMILNAIQNKLLIHSVNTDKSKKEITVYGSVYDDFDSPDKLEIMVGILNTEDSTLYRSVGRINEAEEKLKSRGQVTLRGEIRLDDNRKTTRLIDAIQGGVIRLVEEAQASEDTADIRTFIQTNKMIIEYRHEMNQFFMNYYPGNRIIKMELKMVLAELVCHLFFSDTMAGVILNRMVQIEINNPNDTQASLISAVMIELVTEWVATQIEVIS